ncbi:MAG TPA: FtsX-like permease family protein [Jiangellales bacterium]|nr:FtsX-like permease family protein [Jiangellales bacterium]
MPAIARWWRLDVRRRWRSLLVLAALVAIASGVVMTAVAGANRAASAMDRLLAQTLPATALVAPLTPGFDWSAVRALPEVEALTEIVFSAFEVDGMPAPSSMMFPPADSEAMSSVERPVVLEGRLADPTRADEVVVTRAFAESSGKGVGDTVRLRLFSPDQVDGGLIPAQVPTTLTDQVWILTTEQAEASLATGVELETTYHAAGSVVEATIVGVVRSPWFSDTLDGDGFVVPSAGLYDDYSPYLLGANGSASINAMVRLRGGEADIPRFQSRVAEITGRSDIEVWNLVSATEKTRDVIRFEAASLIAFAAVAGLAATLLIGLAMARYAISTASDIQVLNAVGMTPRQSRRAALLGPTLAAVAGVTIGAAASIIASQWFPIGSASVVEPTPGLDVDPIVLLVGLLSVPPLVAMTTAGAAGLALRTTRSSTAERPSMIASAAVRAGMPVPIVLGTRFALEPGQARRAVPVRTVLLGMVAGVTGVAAALTFSDAVNDATANPARLGVVYQFEVWAGFDNFGLWPADAGFAAMAELPGVAGINDTRAQIADADGEQITIFSLNPLGTQPSYVLTDGRLPVGTDEIVLGERSARALDIRVGDTLLLAGSGGEADFRVVGVGFVDFIGSILGDANPAGGVITEDGYEALFGGDYVIRYGQVQLEPGTDTEAAFARLQAAASDVMADGAFPAEWITPTEVRELPTELRSVRTLPMAMAGFLALLAVGAVGHALVTAVRRRSHDIAILRAVGMTRRQSRSAVITQAAVVSLIGLAIGIPVGVALGRTIWRSVADTTFMHYVAPAAVAALVFVVPVTLAAAILLALWPGRAAAALPVAEVLRAE